LCAHGFDHGDEVGAPVMDGEIYFFVVTPWVGLAVDEEKAELAGVGGEGEISHGHGVGVIPAGSGGIGREVIAQRCFGSDQRRAFFDCAVIQRIGGEAVPVDQVWAFRAVGDVDGGGLTFFQAEQGARDLAVVRYGCYLHAVPDVQGAGLDAQAKIGVGCWCWGRQGSTAARNDRIGQGCACCN
jgi:hypothetical protein